MSDSNETIIKSDKRDLFVFCPARMCRSRKHFCVYPHAHAWRLSVALTVY